VKLAQGRERKQVVRRYRPSVQQSHGSNSTSDACVLAELTYTYRQRIRNRAALLWLLKQAILSIISTAYHLLSGSRAARLLLNWLI